MRSGSERIIGRRELIAGLGGAALAMPLAAAARAQERRNGATPAANSSFYWQFAQTTRTFTDGALMTRWGSYRNAPGETATLAWNDASQIYAEAAMVPAEDSAEAHVAATFNFMKNFSASGNAITGYCPSAAIDGGKLDRSIQHVDDNAFAAIAYLEAAEAVTSRDSAALAAAADLLAFWLLHSDLSDPSFGGGFWRTTARPFKPTHANGLALQLFLRLYLGSGKREHLDKAHMTYDWLRGTLLDRDGLYAWKISSSGLDRTKFAYDQAIMIEAELLMHRATQHLTHATHLKRAQSLAMALKATLWDPIFGGFLLNSNEPMRSPMFCGWVSQSLIRLYETDRNAAWLDHAQANIDVLNLFLRNPADGGYYSMCKVDGSERSPLRQCADQSWMQRTQALLSRHRGTVEGK